MNRKQFSEWIAKFGYTGQTPEQIAVALSQGVQINSTGITAQMHGTKRVMLYRGNVSHLDKSFWHCGDLKFKEATEIIEEYTKNHS